MEEVKKIIDGVQGIMLVGKVFNFFDQEYLMVQDYNDRGRNDGLRMYGLPGGTIEEREISEISILRELSEEVAFELNDQSSYQKFGCYTKLRPSGLTNQNHLFIFRLNFRPKLKTNDPLEVSKVHLLTFRQILTLALAKKVHEGSVRLILHHLNGITQGSLNEPVTFNGIVF